MRNLCAAIAACMIVFASAPALAADGAHMNGTCKLSGAAVPIPQLKPGMEMSYCPSTTTTQRIEVLGAADCNWDGDVTGTGAGTVTLGVKRCSGTGTAANECQTPMVDSSGVPWVITSNVANGGFSIDSGIYLITASDVSANGRLLCTGR